MVLRSKRANGCLSRGTGGVSVAVLQLAVAAGANVVGTTSNEERAEKLKAIGAKAVNNYTKTENWGEEARKLTQEAGALIWWLKLPAARLSPSPLRRSGQTVCFVQPATSAAHAEPVAMLQAWWQACRARVPAQHKEPDEGLGQVYRREACANCRG